MPAAQRKKSSPDDWAEGSQQASKTEAIQHIKPKVIVMCFIFIFFQSKVIPNRAMEDAHRATFRGTVQGSVRILLFLASTETWVCAPRFSRKNRTMIQG